MVGAPHFALVQVGPWRVHLGTAGLAAQRTSGSRPNPLLIGNREALSFEWGERPPSLAYRSAWIFIIMWLSLR